MVAAPRGPEFGDMQEAAREMEDLMDARERVWRTRMEEHAREQRERAWRTRFGIEQPVAPPPPTVRDVGDTMDAAAFTFNTRFERTLDNTTGTWMMAVWNTLPDWRPNWQVHRPGYIREGDWVAVPFNNAQLWNAQLWEESMTTLTDDQVNEQESSQYDADCTHDPPCDLWVNARGSVFLCQMTNNHIANTLRILRAKMVEYDKLPQPINNLSTRQTAERTRVYITNLEAEVARRNG